MTNIITKNNNEKSAIQRENCIPSFCRIKAHTGNGVVSMSLWKFKHRPSGFHVPYFNHLRYGTHYYRKFYYFFFSFLFLYSRGEGWVTGKWLSLSVNKFSHPEQVEAGFQLGRQLYNKSLKDWSLGKQLILFPSNLDVTLGFTSGNIKILGKQN